MPFNRFLALPPELRCRVWWYFFVPRVVILYFANGEWHSSSRNHAGLSTCHEARVQAQEVYRVIIPVCEGGIYINPAFDTLVLLGQYNDDQLRNIFHTVRPRCLGLSVAGSAFLMKPLPSGKDTLFPNLEQLVVLLNVDKVSPADFSDYKSKLKDCGGIDRFVGHVTGTKEFQLKCGKDGIRVTRLGFIPSAIPASGYEAIPKAEPLRTIDATLRFEERTTSYKFGELGKLFSLLASVSAAFDRTPPRLELFFSNTEPERPSEGILQISTSPIEAVYINEVLDNWRLCNSGVKFEYIAEEGRVTIRQLENRPGGNTHHIRNVSVRAGGCFIRLFDGPTNHGVDTIETIVRHAMRVMGSAAQLPLQTFQSPIGSTLTHQNRAPQAQSTSRAGRGGVQIIGSLSEQALLDLLAEL